MERGLIIKLPRKGNLKDCKNSRGITLLSVIGKILGRIVIDRVRNGVDKTLRKEQAAGYRRRRRTPDGVTQGCKMSGFLFLMVMNGESG